MSAQVEGVNMAAIVYVIIEREGATLTIATRGCMQLKSLPRF